MLSHPDEVLYVQNTCCVKYWCPRYRVCNKQNARMGSNTGPFTEHNKSFSLSCNCEINYENKILELI